MLFKILTFLFIIAIMTWVKDGYTLTVQQEQEFSNDVRARLAFLKDERTIVERRITELEKLISSNPLLSTAKEAEKAYHSTFVAQQKAKIVSEQLTLRVMEEVVRCCENRLVKGFKSPDLVNQILNNMKNGLTERFTPHKVSDALVPSSDSSQDYEKSFDVSSASASASASVVEVNAPEDASSLSADQLAQRMIEEASKRHIPELKYSTSLEESNGQDVYERYLLAALLSKFSVDKINDLFKEVVEDPVLSPYFTVLKAYVLGLIGTPPDSMLCYRYVQSRDLPNLEKSRQTLQLYHRVEACKMNDSQQELIKIQTWLRDNPTAEERLKKPFKEKEERLQKQINTKEKNVGSSMAGIELYESQIRMFQHNLTILKPMGDLLAESQKQLDLFERGRIERNFWVKKEASRKEAEDKECRRKQKQMEKNRRQQARKAERENQGAQRNDRTLEAAAGAAAAAEGASASATENPEGHDGEEGIDSATQVRIQQVIGAYQGDQQTHDEDRFASRRETISLPSRLLSRVQEFYTAEFLPFKRLRYVLETVLGAMIDSSNNGSKTTFYFRGVAQGYIAYQNPNESNTEVGPNQLGLARDYLRNYLGLVQGSFKIKE